MRNLQIEDPRRMCQAGCENERRAVQLQGEASLGFGLNNARAQGEAETRSLHHKTEN